MRGDAFIDLGELTGAADEETEEPLRRPKWRVPGWVTAVVLVLGVLAVAAGPAPRPQVVRVTEFPGMHRGFMLVEGGLLRQDGDQMFLVGADGGERWRIPWRATVNMFEHATAIGNRVLFRVGGEPQDMETIAVDLASGERLWRLDGWVHQIGDVLTRWEETELRIYAADTGRLLWEAAGQGAIDVDSRTGSMFVLDRDQLLTEHDLHTGEVLRSRRLTLPVAAGQVHLEIGPEFVLVVGHTPLGERQELIYLERPTLQPTSPSVRSWTYRYDCGPVECVLNYGAGSGAGVADRATGRILWSVREGEVVVPWEAGGLMLMGFTQWAGEGRAIDLVDPQTRDSRADVTGWTLLSNPDAIDSRLPTSTSRIALFRAERRPTLVAHIGGHGPRVLGMVPAGVIDCRYIAPLLLCRTTSNTIGVWRVDA